MLAVDVRGSMCVRVCVVCETEDSEGPGKVRRDKQRQQEQREEGNLSEAIVSQPSTSTVRETEGCSRLVPRCPPVDEG